MSNPPYHLRKNKAADRFALIEAIRRLPKLKLDLNDYKYFGFGGPYLEDMRLIYEFCPEIQMVSFEINQNVYNRQVFHRPCGKIEFHNSDISSFLTTYEPTDHKSIFWLDYTGLEYSCFSEFMGVISKVVQGSIIKITLRANSLDYYYATNNRGSFNPRNKKIQNFQKMFGSFLPHSDAMPSFLQKEFAYLLKQMLQIAVQEELIPEVTNLTFNPLSSFYYSDGTNMFTLTGIVWPRNDISQIEQAFSDWEFKDLDWNNKPIHIDIPDLSIKERLHLQELLPCNTARGITLRNKLGYLIFNDDDINLTEKALEQYAAFHRYYPYFIRGTP